MMENKDKIKIISWTFYFSFVVLLGSLFFIFSRLSPFCISGCVFTALASLPFIVSGIFFVTPFAIILLVSSLLWNSLIRRDSNGSGISRFLPVIGVVVSMGVLMLFTVPALIMYL